MKMCTVDLLDKGVPQYAFIWLVVVTLMFSCLLFIEYIRFVSVYLNTKMQEDILQSFKCSKMHKCPFTVT